MRKKKKRNAWNHLRKSTRMTVLSCGSFLAMTAVILMFLMICPIDRRERHLLVTQAEKKETAAVGMQDTQPVMTVPVPHTLSTWAVSFELGELPFDYYDAEELEEWEIETIMEEEPDYAMTAVSTEYEEGFQDTDHFSSEAVQGTETTHTQTVTEAENAQPATESPVGEIEEITETLETEDATE